MGCGERLEWEGGGAGFAEEGAEDEGGGEGCADGLEDEEAEAGIELINGAFEGEFEV